jgi:uncharacterized membrane protein
VLLGSLVMVFLIPPFQTNDEVAHWYRTWSVAEGRILCRRIPVVAHKLVDVVKYADVRKHRLPWGHDLADAGAQLPGMQGGVPTDSGACLYSPVSYVLPAMALRLVARPFDPQRSSHILAAFYGARLTNWLLMGAGVLLFLLYVPRARNLTLVMYSLPMTIHQTIAINQDSLIFVAAMLLLWAWWDAPSWPGLVIALGLLMLVKIIYACLLLWVVCALFRLPRERRWRSALVLVIPIVLSLVWNDRATHHAVASQAMEGYLPRNVNPGEQVAFLLANPLRIFRLYGHQLVDYFGRGHLNGGWPGIFGVMGWGEAELADYAYLALALALVGAFLLDLASRETTQPVRSWVVERVGPLVSVLAIAPTVSLIMYVVFSPPRSPYILGVQGRYLLVPLFFALFLVGDWVRALPRWRASRLAAWLQVRAPALGWALFGLCAVGYAEMVRTVCTLYGMVFS